MNERSGLFPGGNRRATYSDPSQSRSESCIAINPLDSQNMIGVSKKFTDSTADKQCVACDNHPLSPFYGNVYVVWGDSAPLKFARSTDHGESWTGQAGGQVTEIAHVDPTYAPEICVSSDGTLHILWHIPA